MTVADATTQGPQSIRDAITEAVEGSEFVASQEGLEDLPTDDDLTPELDSGDDPPVDPPSETASDDGTDYEGMQTYWGTSLEGLSVDQKKAIVAAIDQREGVIHELQKRLAEEPKAKEPQEAEPEPELTDEAILEVLGVDLTDEFAVAEAKKHSLPLAKQLMQLEAQVEKLAENEQSREVVSYWNGNLDRLEAEYGALPGDRVQVLQYAAAEGISDPEVLYFRLTAPARKEVEGEVAKIRQEAMRKAAQGGLRPSTSTANRQVLDTKDKSLREVVKEAALQAQRESGHKWSDVLRRGSR